MTEDLHFHPCPSCRQETDTLLVPAVKDGIITLSLRCSRCSTDRTDEIKSILNQWREGSDLDTEFTVSNN